MTIVPPGFRFHPTEEELLSYYLRKKIQSQLFDLNVIREIDLNKLEPWDIQEKCRVGTTQQNDWYFFSHKDKKYPTGTRTNRATAAGFWKATGRDKIIYASFRRIGMRKTLVFYMGRAPHGQKSDWIMHEYRLDQICDSDSANSDGSSLISGQEEGWVICRIFMKKNHQKQPPQTSHKNTENSLDKILSRATTLIHERFAKLPALTGPAHPVQQTDVQTGFGDWTVLDRLVSFEPDSFPFCPPATHFLDEDDGDLWSLTRLSGFGHVSHEK